MLAFLTTANVITTPTILKAANSNVAGLPHSNANSLSKRPAVPMSKRIGAITAATLDISRPPSLSLTRSSTERGKYQSGLFVKVDT